MQYIIRLFTIAKRLYFEYASASCMQCWSTAKRVGNVIKFKSLGYTALLALALPSMAWAHSVYIFAWVDGTQICTESYFTQRNKVAGGEVHMLNTAGNLLATGTTDAKGLYCFALPEKAQPLEFIVLAGAGHRGTFKMSENELTAAVETMRKLPEPVTTSTTTVANTQPAVETTPTPVAQTTPFASTPPVQNTLDETQIRAIVREELQTQLSPLRQQMAEQREDKTPGVREVVGGIGWLIGLGALGYWWSQRKSRQQ